MGVLYDPNGKTATVYYVYYRAIERRSSGLVNDRFFKVTRNPDDSFSKYNAFILNKFFE